MKSSALRIRIEPELHSNFLECCKNLDRPAAQILREFMREFVQQHSTVKGANSSFNSLPPESNKENNFINEQ